MAYDQTGFFLAFWQKLDLPKMQETRFFQKTRFEICQKLDFSRNFVKFGGHFGTKHPDFHLKLTNFGCKRGNSISKGKNWTLKPKNCLKTQKLDLKTKKLDFKSQKTRFTGILKGWMRVKLR